MTDTFDPYHKWLAIPPAEQPANFYRLLGIALYETDQEAIAAGAVQRIDWIRKFESGDSSEIAKQMREEISAAWMCLRDAPQKQQYDEHLRRLLDTPPTASPTLPRTLFADAVTGAAPAESDCFVPSNLPAANQRSKPRKKSSGLNILLQASAGPIGLVLGYIILCQFGPQYDFLGIWHQSDPSRKPIAATSAAGKELVGPNRKAAAKPASGKAQEPTVEAPAKPTPSAETASAARSSQNDSGAMEAAPRAAAMEPVISPEPPSGDAEKEANKTEDMSVEAPAGAGATMAIPVFATVGELQQAIARCRTADDVLKLIRVHLSGAGVLQDTRNYAGAQLPTWEDRAANDCIRLGDQWMPRTAAKTAREKANDLLNQAVGLLSLENDRSVLERLQDAARIDPEATSALFVLDTHYALGLKNYQEAKVCFNSCLRRRPDDASALNNVALAHVMLGKYADGLKIFRAAVASNSRSPEIVHNVRRLLKQDGLKILVLPPAVRKGFIDLLNDAVSDQTVTSLESYGWLYMLPTPAPAVAGLPAEASDVLLHFAQAKADKTVKVHAQWIEDCQCLWCLGAGKVPCPNRDCVRGKTQLVTGREPIGTFDLITLQPLYRTTTESKDCPTCKGKGYVSCDKCTGKGTDPTVSDIRIEVSKQ